MLSTNQHGSNATMGWGSLLVCCWPGLPGLWFRGSWFSLCVALVFAVLLNLTLLVTFVWTGLISDDTIAALAWPTVLMIWLAAAWTSHRNLPDFMSVPDVAAEMAEEEESSDALFIDARREYLRGHWAEAEGLLKRQIQRCPRDAESRLMLATLYRHTRQFPMAAEQLSLLERFDQSLAWREEMARERELLRLIEDHELAGDDELVGVGSGSAGDSLPSLVVPHVVTNKT